MNSAVILTFHRLTSDKFDQTGAKKQAEQRYTIKENLFRDILSEIPSNKCINVCQLKENLHKNIVCLTFDDGLISDYDIVFKLLKKNGLTGTFFVTVGNIDLPGYTNRSQIIEMAQAGMEIASHGLTHNYLTKMSKKDVEKEIAESKDRLEQILGTGVSSFAAVGGHHKKWMLDFAFNAGYRFFATMVPGRTHCGDDFMVLNRNHIQASHTISYALKILEGDQVTFLLNRLRYDFLHVFKVLLGMRTYDFLKDHLLSLRRTS